MSASRRRERMQGRARTARPERKVTAERVPRWRLFDFLRNPERLDGVIDALQDRDVEAVDVPAGEEGSLSSLSTGSEIDWIDEDDLPEEEPGEVFAPRDDFDSWAIRAEVALRPSELTILRVIGSPPRCHYEPPPGLRSRSERSARYLRAMIGFHAELAAWLNDTRAAFLANPSAKTFVAGDSDLRHPSVTQKGMLWHLNQRLERKGESPWDVASLNRTVPKIMVFWPEHCQRAKDFFSPEARLEWVVRGCLAAVASPSEWVLRRKDFVPARREERKTLQAAALENLSQRERLIALAVRVKVRPEAALNLLEMRLSHG